MRLALLRQKDEFHEPVWHVLIAIVIVIGSQLILNDVLTFKLKYAIVGLETLLLLILSVFSLSAAIRRAAALLLVAVISIVNIISLSVIIKLLFAGEHVDGRQLLVSAVIIYITNIIMFGLWYWELDNTRTAISDFQFPQATADQNNKNPWRPTFFDYLYVSITNATAFSPTDTLPLTHRAKFLMTVQATASLLTVVLVAARAVNILS